LLFGAASCSLSIVAVLFNKTDASQPCFNHKYYKENVK
jgi:hypothetical protein